MANRIQSFKDLIVYQKAFSLQQDIFEVSKSFPREERFSLTDQILRASRSVGSNIAEAWHKRLYPAGFVSKLSDSDAEQAETLHWLDTSMACDCLSDETYKRLSSQCSEVGRLLGSMMADKNKWCGR